MYFLGGKTKRGAGKPFTAVVNLRLVVVNLWLYNVKLKLDGSGDSFGCPPAAQAF